MRFCGGRRKNLHPQDYLPDVSGGLSLERLCRKQEEKGPKEESMHGGLFYGDVQGISADAAGNLKTQ